MEPPVQRRFLPDPLSLASADEIQSSTGGVRPDTMFVAKGFGILNGEAIQNAMQALSQLREGRRLVSIISRVTGPKERIDQHIVVKKSFLWKQGGDRVLNLRIFRAFSLPGTMCGDGTCHRQPGRQARRGGENSQRTSIFVDLAKISHHLLSFQQYGTREKC